MMLHGTIKGCDALDETVFLIRNFGFKFEYKEILSRERSLPPPPPNHVIKFYMMRT